MLIDVLSLSHVVSDSAPRPAHFSWSNHLLLVMGGKKKKGGSSKPPPPPLASKESPTCGDDVDKELELVDESRDQSEEEEEEVKVKEDKGVLEGPTEGQEKQLSRKEMKKIKKKV